MKNLSIIIVNYNVKEFLMNLLHSLEVAAADFSSEIIVVDNASTDGSVEEIKQKFPGINLIANKKNIGFGPANNQALKIAGGKFILLINPDTIVKEDTLTKLFDFFDSHPDAGLIGCKVLNPDGTLQLACRRSFPKPWTAFTKIIGLSSLFPKSKLFARYNLTYLDENQLNEVDAISGSFMLMKREVYDKIGGFDPKFFMYGEDLDFCYRTQKAGFKVYYVPTTEIIHYKGESTKRSNIDETKMFYDAMHLFVKKHFSSFFLVEWILRSAILVRKLFAFLNIYRLPLSSAIIDFVLFVSALIFIEAIYKPGQWLGIPDDVKPWVYIIPAMLQIFISFLSGAYKKNTISNLRIIISLVIGLIFISSITYFFKQFGYSRAVILFSYLILFFAFSAWRILVKVFFKIGTLAESYKNTTLIVGSEFFGSGFTRKIKSNSSQLFNIVGLIAQSQKNVGEKIGAFEIIGSLDNIRNVIHEKKINNVIFLSGEVSYDKMFEIISTCQGLNVEFMVAGKGQDYLVGKSSVTLLDDIPLLKVNYNISQPGFKIIKRVFDLALSSLALLLFYLPVYLLSAIRKRTTHFGKFILESHKVFTGQKSFVGPYWHSSKEGLYLGKRGLTGLWFIEKVDINDKDDISKLDIYYAKNQNIWLDLEILGKTLSLFFIKAEK